MKVNAAPILGKSIKNNLLILAGDIGATKTNLGLFALKGNILSSMRISSFRSADYPDFSLILKSFINNSSHHIDAACFGIAGPIANGICRTTNLPWVVDTSRLKSLMKNPMIKLINDMEATAYGVQTLSPKSFAVLNAGHSQAFGNIAVIAAGTGLGEGMLLWNGKQYEAVASEGGHADFAPSNALELDLCRRLLRKFGHSSYERVLSGPGFLNIYDFLKMKKFAPEPSWLKKELTQGDHSIVITRHALSGKSKLCVKTLDLFCAIYGAEAGNLALKILARGGVYLGGGIAPKILDKLKDGTFKKSFLAKGRFSAMLSHIPVHVILEEKTALYGAAVHALRIYTNRGKI